ncbi:hypothetical protein TNCV_4890151 [Trichonephila clavipes]|nr:hypothetical protein TNCV_4890151 [Trichonephila clavipes]
MVSDYKELETISKTSHPVRAVSQHTLAKFAGSIVVCIDIADASSGQKRKLVGDEKTRERSPALDGEKGKSPALDRESMRGEPWLERTGRER